MLATLKSWFSKRKEAGRPCYERTVYSFADDTVRVVDPLGSDVSIRVVEMIDIGIETNCLGPFVEDVFWLINRDRDSLRIPQCSPLFKTLMERFEKLEGFDWAPFNQSMSCAQDAYFPCWRREEGRQRPEGTPGKCPPFKPSQPPVVPHP